jgi:tetratricopeptide (TPR) repeat protein
VSKLSPQQGQAALQEAVALHQQGQLAAAEKGYARVLKSFPDQFDALHLLGLLKLQSGKAGEAQRLIVAALKIAPNAPDAHANLGLVLGALKRPADALASFERALALAPDHIEALANRANLLLDLGRAKDALAALDHVLAREPRHLPSRVNRANALMALGRPDDAIAEYDAALALNPNDLKALFNRANALFRAGRYAQSLDGFDRLLALVPQHAEALSSRGLALQTLGRHQDALASYAKAIAFQKDYVDAHHNEALALLTVGEYARGFAEYEWRWKRAGIARRSFGKPLWLGEYPLGRKTILLHAEQGLGDTIQFARYAPLLARGGAKVVLEAQGELKDLLSALEGVTVVARGEKLPAYDVHAPLGSLPLALKTTPENVPAAIPYLRASAARIAKWRSRLEVLPPGLRVALAWAGNPAHINDRNRSIALARLQPLLATPRMNFISIQRDVPESDRALLAARKLVHLGAELADFNDTAAVIALCDRVITVDTSVAHLAGALGRDTWILLPFWPDWRWTLTEDTSPWYPAARLFRQGADGDWDAVIERVRSENAMMFVS